MSEQFFVYALLDPFDEEVRYIGISKNADSRFCGHLSEARSGEDTYKCRWIRSLLEIGHKPKLFILHSTITWKEACELERVAIREARAEGFRLTNGTDGGDGTPGSMFTPEVLAKMSAKGKKQWEDPEKRAKQRAESNKRWADPEFRAKMTAANKKVGEDPEQRAKRKVVGKKVWEDPEHRAKMSIAAKNRWKDPEQRAKRSAQWLDPKFREKMSAANKKAKADPEVLAKLSADQKKRWADPEFRAKMLGRVGRKRKETKIADTTTKPPSISVERRKQFIVEYRDDPTMAVARLYQEPISNRKET